jgi:adenine-specific DNA-methyltransferase
MQKLKLHSPDFTQENIATLAELFPNCVTEIKDEGGKMKDERGSENSSFIPQPSSLKYAIDFDQLRQELSTSIVEGSQERYQLNWPGKREALLTANAPIAKTLRPCREESVDFDSTQNLFIEGDNLDALKLLQETYLGKVKMIYIDPPYNTGNDFIYEDDFAEDTASYMQRSNQKDDDGNRLVANNESNGRFHSDWLSMMYPRLKLARNLLRDDGVIFISIDDNEQANLKRLCDEVFGGGCFKNSIVVRRGIKNVQAQFEDISSLSSGHEYILVYSKDSTLRFPKLIFTHESAKPGKWDTFWRGTDRPTMRYELFGITPEKGQWRWEEQRAKEAVENYQNYLENYSTSLSLDEWYLDNLTANHLKLNFLRKNDEGSVQYYVPPSEGRLLSDNWMDILLSGNETEFFDTEKNELLIERIVKWICSLENNDIILDFFSGSSTTAHAVMQLNAEDGGKRKFIMVQIPEACDEKSGAFKAGYKTIAEISKERIRQAGKKIKADNADKEGIDQLDIGFRVLKIDSSNMKDVYYTPDAVQQTHLFDQVDNIREDRTAEDLLFQVLLDWGVDLTLPITQETILVKDKGGRMKDEITRLKDEGERMKSGSSSFIPQPSSFKQYQVFFVDDNALAACFDADINEAFVKELAARHPLRVVFRDAGFVSDSVKINIEQIFKLISPNTEIKTI